MAQYQLVTLCGTGSSPVGAAMISGKEAEIKFFNKMKEISKEVRWATREEDMFKHFDIVADGVKYDVKSHKKINRWDSTEDNTIVWLEMNNVRGDKGWLLGEADKIAFFVSDREVLIFSRKDLMKWAAANISHPEKEDFHNKKKGRWYKRPGRKDWIAYVDIQDIMPIFEQLIYV